MRSFSIVVVLASFFLCTHVHAATATVDLSYECALNGIANGGLLGCVGSSVGGYETSTAAVVGNNTSTIACGVNSTGGITYCAARSDQGLSVAPIHAWGVCRWVDNTKAASLFVPFRTANEWQQFLTNTPTGLKVWSCAEPYTETGVAPTTTFSPAYDPTCTAVDLTNPNVYGRTGVSLWPFPALSQSFTCHNGATVITSQVQWKAGNLVWTPQAVYSPDLTLTANQASPSIAVASGSSVTLSWGTEHASSCVASGGWNGARSPSGGTVSVTPAVTTTYSLACAGKNGLTSTASVTVYVNGCGVANGVASATAPVDGLCSAGTASDVVQGTDASGNPIWGWSCGAASCSAPAGGTCGTATGVTSALAPTGNLCALGAASNVVQTTDVNGNPMWSWSCGATACAAPGPGGCIPTGQPVPAGQVQCPTDSCFFQVSGVSLVDPSLVSGAPDGLLDPLFAPVYGEIVGPGNYPASSPMSTYAGPADTYDYTLLSG